MRVHLLIHRGNIARRQLFESQGERLQEKPNEPNLDLELSASMKPEFRARFQTPVLVFSPEGPLPL